MNGRVPVYFGGDITQAEIMQAMRDAGLHLYTEAGHRLVVDRVPGIVRKDPPLTNVLRLPTRARKVAGR